MWPELGLSMTGKQFIFSVIDVDENDITKPWMMKGCPAPPPVETHAMS